MNAESNNEGKKNVGLFTFMKISIAFIMSHLINEVKATLTQSITESKLLE